MKTFLLLLLVTLKLSAQGSVVIIPGSSGDVGFSSPPGYTTTAYTIPQFVSLPLLPPGTNSTLRYGQNFAYTIYVPSPAMYVLLLGFAEPTVQGPGQRIFSVWANDQPIVQNLDLYAEAGYLQPVVKTAVVYIQKSITIQFVASVRNAVVSLISITGVGVIGQGQQCIAIPACRGWGYYASFPTPNGPAPYLLIPVDATFQYRPSQWQ